MDERYSVLMSVYRKEKPEYFRAALLSIRGQSCPADEVVLVCDGPLTKELDQVIQEFQFQESFPRLKVIRLPENLGLGGALSKGLACCKNELVARMDTDDIAEKNRCQRQLSYFKEHPETDVLSGTLAEFEGGALTEKEAAGCVLAKKSLPSSHQELSAYLKYRNPVNHPCVMFRKGKAERAGGYQPCPLFEDYDLWVRMYLQGCRFANLSQTILYMRVNDMHMRRGGISYARVIIAFQVKMHRRGVITLPQCLYSMAVRVAVSLLPNRIRKRLYGRKLRSPGRELKGKR